MITLLGSANVKDFFVLADSNCIGIPLRAEAVIFNLSIEMD
jgi:hypothetical protein